ncbi:MAG: GNAT family protein [Conexivisphaerales archaeon]|jgi:RimJ/RimL family protein N-acetyltransferase
MVIAGKGVYLRGLERDDLKLMHKWLNDSEIMQWARSQPDNIASMESVEKEFELDLKGENPHRRTFILAQAGTDRPIGWASMRWWRPFSTTVDIGLVIAEKGMRGKGIGSEATRLLTSEAFSQLHMHKVELWTRADNKAAQKVAKNCGFRLEGTDREAIYFDGKFHDGLTFGVLEGEFRMATSKTK